jgi:hypothetical protein
MGKKSKSKTADTDSPTKKIFESSETYESVFSMWRFRTSVKYRIPRYFLAGGWRTSLWSDLANGNETTTWTFYGYGTTYKKSQDKSRNGFVTVNTYVGILIGSLSHEGRSHNDSRNTECLHKIGPPAETPCDFGMFFFASASPVGTNSLLFNAV